MQEITCFKAYDVRGRVPDQLNEDIALRIGQAYAEVVKPRQVVVGHDIRLSSEIIKTAVIRGLLKQGVDVYDIGLSQFRKYYRRELAPPKRYISIGMIEVPPGNPKFGWLRNPDHYQWVRALWQQDRMLAVPGDMLGSKTMRNIGKAAKEMGIEADCRVRVYIDAKGKPYDVKIEACPKVFHDALLATAWKWRFYPQKIDGESVPTQFVQPVSFKLSN